MCDGHGDRMQRIKYVYRIPVIKSKQISYLSCRNLRVHLPQQVREAYQSPAASDEVKNDGAISTLTYVLITFYLIN